MREGQNQTSLKFTDNSIAIFWVSSKFVGPKNFFFSNFEYEYKKRIIWRWFRNCWEKCEKFANKKVMSKLNVCKIGVCSFYSTTLQKFLGNIFSRCTFFHLFSLIWKRLKILRIFDTHMQKRIKQILMSLITHMSIFWN